MWERKIFAISIEDYRALVAGNYYHVDKTLLIQRMPDSGSKVTLHACPRRFGKPLSLPMQDYFFNGSGFAKGIFDACALARSEHP